MASKVFGGVDCNLLATSSEEEVSNFGVIKRRSADRHKKVQCDICSKTMLSDHFKRHMKVHNDIYSMDEDEARKEIVLRKEVRKKEEKKQLNFERIAKEEGASKDCFAQETKVRGLVLLQRIDPQEVKHHLLLGQ